MTTNVPTVITSTTTIEADLQPIGTLLQNLSKTQKKTMRQISKDTGLSVNSVKVVFNGERGNVATYDTVARYLGTSFVQAVISAYNINTGKVSTPTV